MECHKGFERCSLVTGTKKTTVLNVFVCLKGAADAAEKTEKVRG